MRWKGEPRRVLDVAQLAGGVALEGQQSIVAEHAATVVGDADQAAAAGFDLDAQLGGPGVERILEQLFDDRSGALDDFTGGDLVGDLVGQDADAAHGRSYSSL
jgi:hypothetical protein